MLKLPNAFTFNEKKWQAVGASSRRGATTYTDGLMAFVDAAPAVVETAGPLFAIARLLVSGDRPVTVKVSRDAFGPRPPAEGSYALLVPERDAASGRLVSRLFVPLAATGRADSWDE